MKYLILTLSTLLMLTTSSATLNSQTSIDLNYFVFGRDSLPLATEISDTLFFFNQSKGAFRGGRLDNSDAWAPDSLGSFSFGYGVNVKASGDDGATAFGIETNASGDIGATALGRGTTASGVSGATALGRGTTASGISGATALGFITEASGGFGATALGRNTTASGDSGSTALGRSTTASGDGGATALGYFTEATGDNCTVIGRYNDTIVTAGQNIDPTSPLFIVGNGDSGSPSNAMVIRKDGRVGIGLNAPTAMIHISTPTKGDSTGIQISSGTNKSLMYHDSNGDLIIRKNNFDTMLVLSSPGGNGRVGIGRRAAANRLEVQGKASKNTAGDWLANSDRRIKTNIQTIENAMDIIQHLRPVKFKYTAEWKSRNPSIKDQYYYNFIAQEYQTVFPHSVQSSGEYLENDDEAILQIDTYNAQIANIAATQELITENIGLRERVSKLENSVSKLENKFEMIISSIGVSVDRPQSIGER